MARLSIAAFGGGEDRTPEVVERRSANLVRTAHPSSLVAETVTGRLVGLAVTRQLGSVLLLAWAAVDPDYQGRGILRAMLASWPAHEAGITRLVLSSPDPRAMRAYAQLGLDVLPTISAGGILRPGAVERPAEAQELRPRDAQDLLAALGAEVRGGAYPPSDVGVLDAQGDRVHVVDLGRGHRAAVVRGEGVIRLIVATDEGAARLALRAALTAVPGGATVHLNQLRAGMDWAIQEALAAGLQLSPEGPVYADAPLSRLYLPNGSLG
jgi:GNAT superfamily N-acetyltransferase